MLVWKDEINEKEASVGAFKKQFQDFIEGNGFYSFLAFYPLQ